MITFSLFRYGATAPITPHVVCYPLSGGHIMWLKKTQTKICSVLIITFNLFRHVAIAPTTPHANHYLLSVRHVIIVLELHVNPFLALMASHDSHNLRKCFPSARKTPLAVQLNFWLLMHALETPSSKKCMLPICPTQGETPFLKSTVSAAQLNSLAGKWLKYFCNFMSNWQGKVKMFLQFHFKHRYQIIHSLIPPE